VILCNSLLILPRHTNKVGIVIYDNLQAQEIIKLNNKPYNTIYSIKNLIRPEGFIFEASGHHGKSKWYLKTKDITLNNQLQYHRKFNTTYYLKDLEHYWLCPHCKTAIADTWLKCDRCR
jgi:hypothetical protein